MFGEKVCRSEWMRSHCPYSLLVNTFFLLEYAISILLLSLNSIPQDVNTWGGYLGQVDEKDIESIQTALGAGDA